MWKRILPLLLVASVADAQIYTITTVAEVARSSYAFNTPSRLLWTRRATLHRPFRLGQVL